MALVFGTDYHNFAVSFNYLALVAHGFYGRSYFHNFLLDKVILKVALLRSGRGS